MSFWAAESKLALSQGLIIIVFPPVTSGSELIAVVISGVPSASVSVCTDQKPSDSEGAITPSTWETRALNSDFGSPLYILTRFVASGGIFSKREKSLVFISVSLCAGIKLKINWRSSDCVRSSGTASKRVSIPLEIPVCQK